MNNPGPAGEANDRLATRGMIRTGLDIEIYDNREHFISTYWNIIIAYGYLQRKYLRRNSDFIKVKTDNLKEDKFVFHL